MKYIIAAITFCLMFNVLLSQSIFAQNNKFGVHIAVPSDEDIDKAAELVNGSGGEYGYITIVIQDDRREVAYWQSIFDKFRRQKLIPIVRIATRPDGDVWKAPDESDIANWVSFFQKLNWVTRDRYIIIFNEPNHAAEWGGEVDPAKYGEVAGAYARALKSASPDYKIMLAGLDLSAPESYPMYADAYLFLQTATKSFCGVVAKESGPKCGDYIDAISSHAYPNPGFVGSPYDVGRKSIKGYETEISWFGELFDGKQYPVYITETGWDSDKLSHSQVASYFEYSYTNIWLPDERVKAVTPFILNYQGQPFLGFSLLELGSVSPKLQFIKMQSMPKVKGRPDIVDGATITGNLPDNFVELGRSVVAVEVTNTGQAIWTEGAGYKLIVNSTPNVLSAQISLPARIEPQESTNIFLPIYSGEVAKDVPGVMTIAMVKGDGQRELVIGSTKKTFVLHPQPSAIIKANMMSKGLSSGTDFELQIFDGDEKLIYRKKDLAITLGRGALAEMPNIVPGIEYRFVLLKPYYLPRQTKIKIANGENIIEFEKLLPLDLNNDGAFTLGDVQGLFVKKDKNSFGIIEKINLFLPFK